MKKLVSLFLAGILAVSGMGTVVLAGESLMANKADEPTMTQQEAEELFDEESLEILIDQANEMEILPDKNDDGTFPERSRRAAYGTYTKRKGVILVTSDAYKGLIPTGHAAIGYNDNQVVESLSNGVTTGPHNWNLGTVKNQAYQTTPKDTTAAQDAAVADWCYAQRGKPYNFNFLDINTRAKFYCSQLVWAGYKDKYGVDLNNTLYGDAIHPMEFVSSYKITLLWRKK
jgi:uncharacterized protein YycO